MIRIFRFTLLLLLAAAPSALFAQYDVDSALNQKVEIENPIYKPVVAIGSGVFNFYGDVRNTFINPVIGDFAYKVNVSAFIDPKRNFKANFFFIYGQLSADQRSYTDISKNLNFRTDLVDFGINIEYGFQNVFKKFTFIRPFVSLGLENIQFTPKGDIYFGKNTPYNYWTDGTIRTIAQNQPNSDLAQIMHRDFIFETDLRQYEKDNFELGNYSQNAFSLPIDLGLDFRISERVICRLGTSLHLTSTDYLDNVSTKGTNIVGRKGNDNFTYSYFTVHFDLFSQPKTMIIEKMFAELEIDDVMFDDEDGDFIMDPVDQCPGTPYGIVVDSVGCPLDTDKDGVYDYLDLEPDTQPGAWVDADGKTIKEDVYLSNLLKRSDAMKREDVMAYFASMGKKYTKKSVAQLPAKFKNLDLNNDGDISFEELLHAIDNYFDFKLDLKVEDIYELNNYFFEQ